MVVYKITNKVNNKIYIGQTVRSMKARKADHLKISRYNHQRPLYKAFYKYGIDNFKWQVICICPNIDSLNAQEQYYIVHYNSNMHKNGYNLTSGGDNCLYSDVSKQKMREKKLGVYDGENNPMYGVHRFGKDNPMYGKHHTQETKNKISKTRKELGLAVGKKNPMFGRCHTDESKKKMSETIKSKHRA